LKVVLRIRSVEVNSIPVIFPKDGLNVKDLVHSVTVINGIGVVISLGSISND
jgi:hypothetical protein